MVQQFKLYYVTVLLLLAFVLTLATPFNNYNSSDSDSLVLVHVLFRHGDKTPDQHYLWKSNPYYNESFYEPYGYGQLTNGGKRREYNLGRALRERYGNFLGDQWNIKLYDTWSTNYNRTKMSAVLVQAGLFPPIGSDIWQWDLLWQPVAYNSLPVPQDKELSAWACSTVLPLIYGDESNMRKLKSYDSLMETLSRGTGEDVDYLGALDVYVGMLTQEQLGFPLENWTKAVYPEPLTTYIVDFYYIETSTKELKTVMAGYLLKKIIADTVNKINGTLNPQERKIFLYSGHEVNIATVLIALEAFNLVSLPSYGSNIAFEVHRIDDVYGIKILYQDHDTDEPQALRLPGCGELCPIDQFIKLTADIIPKSDAECYGQQ